jgi:hypothetical protein
MLANGTLEGKSPTAGHPVELDEEQLASVAGGGLLQNRLGDGGTVTTPLGKVLSMFGIQPSSLGSLL